MQITSLLLGVLLVGRSQSSPLPQTAEEEPEYYYEEYGAETDEDVREGTRLEDIMDTLLGLGSGVVDLLTAPELHQRVGEAVALSANLTGQLVEMTVPVAQAAVEQVPRLLNRGSEVISNIVENEVVQEQVSRAGAVAGAVVDTAPRIVDGGNRLVGGLIKATNDTAPLVVQNLQELAQSLPLFAQFARAFIKVNAEDSRKVFDRFGTSLRCDLECRDVVSSPEKEECEKKYCQLPVRNEDDESR